MRQIETVKIRKFDAKSKIEGKIAEANRVNVLLPQR